MKVGNHNIGMNKEYREIEYTVTEADGRLTAGEIMRERLMLSSREVSRCKQFDDGVMCKGMPIRIISVLEPGEVLTVRLYEDIENGSLIIPSDEPIDIVYEDEDLILLNKKGDMVVHPSYAHYKDSLSNALAGYYKKTGQEHVMRVIGRLDRETSGLIIFQLVYACGSPRGDFRGCHALQNQVWPSSHGLRRTSSGCCLGWCQCL